MKQLFQINNTFYHKELSEGNLSEICQKNILNVVFEENPLRNEIDISLDPYESIWLKLITILVYGVEVIRESTAMSVF